MANPVTNISSSSRTLWIGLIVAISLGFAIEFLKSTRGSVAATAGRTRIFGLVSGDGFGDGSDGRLSEVMLAREKADRARSRLSRQGRIAGLDRSTPASSLVTSSPATSPGTPALVPALVQTAAQKAEALKKVNAKKLADAKKKKKKKKKDAEPEAIASAPIDTSSDDKSKTPKASDNDFGGGSSLYGNSGPTSATAGARAKDVNENPETLDRWIEFILREPSYERTLKLVEAQQRRSIDSEIFHEVVRQMLADSREKMHEFAIYALGSSPSLKSFLLLEQANSLQPEGSALRLRSRAHLKAYSKLENLRILASVISTQVDARISYEALKLIQVAVSTYRPRNGTSGGATPGVPSTSATSPQVSRQFSSLVSVLTRFALIAPDETLQQEATQTLQQVQSLVGPPPTIAAIAP